jgi:hypothetical protein
MGAPALAAPAESTRAFEQAFATSLYVFDACGDGDHGVIFRQALAEKMAQCSISENALKRFRQRTAALLKNEKDRLNKAILERGGYPDRIEGMPGTCHEHQSSPSYVHLRDKLNEYSEGLATFDAIIPGGCDAEAFTP